MKVKIDRTQCVSCGSCWDTCPELFEQDPEDSFSGIREKFRTGTNAEGTVPEERESCAQEAADSCPVQIISITG
jgi:ferredoxin